MPTGFFYTKGDVLGGASLNCIKIIVVIDVTILSVEILSAAKAPKKDGKGNPYADIVSMHMPILDAVQTASGKTFKRAFCS